MRSLLRLNQHDPDIHKWVREVRCHKSEERSLVGFRMREKAAEWFEQEFMPQVREWHEHTFGMDGTLPAATMPSTPTPTPSSDSVVGGSWRISASEHALSQGPRRFLVIHRVGK